MSQLKIVSRQLLLAGLTVVLLAMLANSPALGAVFGAIANGNWNSASTWLQNSVPTLGDNVYIGSADGASAPSAVVTMTRDEFASQVILGNGAGASGTLDLGNFKLTLSDLLYVGYSPGSSATGLRGSGYFTAPTMEVDCKATFTYNALDAVSYLSISSNAAATTAATGNITSHINIVKGGRLTLGADMVLGDYLSLQDTNSQIDMAGHSLKANQILIGTNGSAPVVLNPGTINAAYLSVVNVNLDLNAGGMVTKFDLNHGNSAIRIPLSQLNLYNGAAAATVEAGNVSGSVIVAGGSKLMLGSNMTLTGAISLEGSSSILDMTGHSLAATQILVGWNGGAPAVLNRGTINANILYVANENFNLNTADKVSAFVLKGGGSAIDSPLVELDLSNGAVASTTAAGKVTGTIAIVGGSHLTLGSDTTLSGNLVMQDNGSTLDMGGHSLRANQIYFGWNSTGSPNFQADASLVANDLYVGGHSVLLATSIQVNNLVIGETPMTAVASLAGDSGMNAAPVPEPSAIAMIGMGIVGVLALIGRSKKKRTAKVL